MTHKEYKNALFEKKQMRHKKRRIQSYSPEAVARRCSVKKVFLEISQNSQENTCARVSAGLQLY